MATHTYQYTVTDGAVRINASESIAASASISLDETVTDSSTDFQINVSVTEDDMVSFALVSTQDVTVKTNDSGSPQETITLKANRPLIWGVGGGTKPISDDLTALYVTNASGSDATVKLVAGWDATP